MMPRLTTLAPELLQHIAFHAAEPLGPPAALCALQLTCRSLRTALAYDTAPYLYARIFRLKFDISAPRRRLGPAALHSRVLAHELRARCATLQRLREKRIWGEYVREDLWRAYLMMLEDDGRNETQLISWAGLKDFVILFLAQRIGEGAEQNAGWPLESEENALAVWLLWLVNDHESIRTEPADVRNFIVAALQPFIVAPFKYQPFLVPDTHYALPLVGTPSSNPPICSLTSHGLFPVYRSPSPVSLVLFGTCVSLCAPPLTPAALLSEHARRQLIAVQPPRMVLKRRAMLPPGVCDVTLEDYDEVNRLAVTKCVKRAKNHELSPSSFLGDEDTSYDMGDEEDLMDVELPFTFPDVFDGAKKPNLNGLSAKAQPASLQHEHDWLRLTRCYDPWLDAKIKIRVFTPGMLDGLWSGRMFAYSASEYHELLQHEAMHPRLALWDSSSSLSPNNQNNPYDNNTLNVGAASFPAAYQMPLFMRLREHHCLEGSLPVGWGQDVLERECDGLRMAWLPPDVELVEGDGKLRIFDPLAGESLTYETHVPGRPNSHIASGGCSKCRPSEHSSCPPSSSSSLPEMRYVLTPEQHREAEALFEANGLSRDLSESESEDDDSDEFWSDIVEDGCVTDIVITGETDFVHGRAWGFYRFVGRIRDEDGLVILLRIPEAPNTLGAGTFVFRGYIHSNQNFVGRWRAANEPPDMPTALEGSFSLCKRA
ncbi:hypothetical protein DFH11DRAFT_1590158 [Phellopilus nigrolimitatus]|nr:hypothetical protein DFH11DRAFT_1590158 [Phellopilus nigrolimitatus]